MGVGENNALERIRVLTGGLEVLLMRVSAALKHTPVDREPPVFLAIWYSMMDREPVTSPAAPSKQSCITSAV